jgi:hypothetical protein
MDMTNLPPLKRAFNNLSVLRTISLVTFYGTWHYALYTPVYDRTPTIVKGQTPFHMLEQDLLVSCQGNTSLNS